MYVIAHVRVHDQITTQLERSLQVLGVKKKEEGTTERTTFNWSKPVMWWLWRERAAKTGFTHRPRSHVKKSVVSRVRDSFKGLAADAEKRKDKVGAAKKNGSISRAQRAYKPSGPDLSKKKYKRQLNDRRTNGQDGQVPFAITRRCIADAGFDLCHNRCLISTNPRRVCNVAYRRAKIVYNRA